MGKGGKGGGQTVTQNADPWSGSQGYLRQGMHDLQQIYQSGAPTGPNPNGAGTVAPPSYFPGQTVQPMSPWTSEALNAQAARGRNGSPLTDAARDQLTATMRGDYLAAGNPHLQGAIDAATAPVKASVDSLFSGAGRYGGNSHVDGLSSAIGDISSRMAYQNYGDERNRQQQGMMFAPQLAQQDYFDINQLGAAGQGATNYYQSLINADIDRYNYGQDSDWLRAKDYLATIMGAGGLGSTTRGQQGQTPNIFSSALGTGMGLAGLGSMLGLFGGGGSSALGALAGTLAFSDERLKTDVEEIGMLHSGLPLYSYHYTFDEPGAPKHVGVMAQDTLHVKPDAVHQIGDYLAVDYGKVIDL